MNWRSLLVIVGALFLVSSNHKLFSAYLRVGNKGWQSAMLSLQYKSVEAVVGELLFLNQ